jgi:FrmR/RcnR family transcriptional regulator, repressor of frmRAB operon
MGTQAPLDNTQGGYIRWFRESARAMHTVRERDKLVARVRRIRGQIEAVERAIVEEKGCHDVLQTVTAARGALNSLVAEMIEDHIRFHVLDPGVKVPPKRARAADELIDIVRAYVK